MKGSKEYNKLDEIEKKILEILNKYPDGLSCRQIWNKLRDEKGRPLVAFPTLLNRLNDLEEEGYIIIDESNWKQGRAKVVKLIGIGKDLSDLISKINDLKGKFRKYININLQNINYYIQKLKNKEVDEKDLMNFIDNVYLKLNTAKKIILDQLEEEKRKILYSENYSISLKKELLFEILEAEKDIEKMMIEAYSSNVLLSVIKGLENLMKLFEEIGKGLSEAFFLSIETKVRNELEEL